MSNFNTRTLTGKGSVSFHDKDGNSITYQRGEAVESASDWKAIPDRQQAYFDKIEAEDKVDAEDEPTLEDQVDEELTVEKLQEALNEADVSYKSDANKPALIDLYIENVLNKSEEEN